MTSPSRSRPRGPRSLLDRALDLAVVPGYGSAGYRLRCGAWGEPADESLIAGGDVVVTGASAGIGEAACAELVAHGARVHMVARDRGRLEAAAARVAARVPPDSRGAVETSVCDVSDLAAVRAFAGRLRHRDLDLRGVLHNAGVLVDERRRTAQGHELTLATHVLGPLLLSGLLAPELRAGAPSRVVFVSSGGMYTAGLRPDDLELDSEPFDGPRFYAHAKRLQVLVAEMLAARWRTDAVAVYSMHPGWVRTGGLADALPGFSRVTGPLLRSPEQGADTAVWLLASREAPRDPSGFWHDRRARPTNRLPWTRANEAEREQVLDGLVRASGFDDRRGDARPSPGFAQ